MPYSYHTIEQQFIGLTWKFFVNPISCNRPSHYENYLRLCAIDDFNRGVGVTHLILDCNEQGEASVIAGFITLRATSLVSTDENNVKLVHPSLEIAELAVHQDYERRGIGTQLVNLAIYTADKLRRELIGIKYIVLCSDSKSITFYEKLGFGRIGDLYETLREGWNNDCEPMYICLNDI